MKIFDSIRLSTLNNAEYGSHMGGIRAGITKATPEKLKLDSAVLASFDKSCEQLDDAIVRLHGHELTGPMSAADDIRDKRGRFLIGSIRNATGLDPSDRKDAADELWKVAKAHRNFMQLPLRQETQIIKSIIYDLRKPENAARVTELGLDNDVVDLEAANNSYEELDMARENSIAGDELGNSKTIRSEIDKLYDQILHRVSSVHDLEPSAETTSFISTVNQLTASTKLRYKLRLSGKKTDSEDSGGSEQA